MQDPRDVRGRQAEVVRQDEHRAVLDGELEEGPLQLVAIGEPGEIVIGCGPIDVPEPHDDYSRVADRDALDRAFLRLSFDQRAVLVLTHYVGLSGPEVAETLGIPVGTVASRLHYAIRAMRAELAPSPAFAISTAEHVR